jgi:hypothetical protein
MLPEQREIQKRKRILDHALQTGNVRLTCRYFGIGRATFYRLEQVVEGDGDAGRANRPPPGQHRDPIREHPRFKALLVKYANPEGPAG